MFKTEKSPGDTSGAEKKSHAQSRHFADAGQEYSGAPPSQPERARDFTRAGIRIFPCRASEEIDMNGVVHAPKSPCTMSGFKDATADELVVQSWWKCWPDALIGIPTGKATNTVVVDVDRKNGKDGFKSLAERGIELPATFVNPTLNNGEHWIYQRPDVDKFPGRNGAFPGVDIKADGGYIIAWGNLRAEDLQAITPFPEALTEALEREKRPNGATPPSPTSPSQRAEFGTRKEDLAREYQRAREWLDYIDPSDRETWNNVGLQLYGTFGDDGFELWDDWSSRCPDKYNKKRTQADQWADFAKKNPRPGIGLLRSLAVKGGWKEGEKANGANYEHGANDAKEPREWGDPHPIEAELHPVEGFDAEALLPDVFREFVTDVADRMPCAVDYVASAIIVALGAVIGAKAGIKPKRLDDWVVVPNLWGGVVGDPSQKKSPAIGEAMKPLGRLIARAADEFKKAQGDSEVEQFITDAKREALESKVKTTAKKTDYNKQEMEGLKEQLRSFISTAEPDPVMRRYRTNDSTVEKLGELLRDNSNGLLVSRDELVGLLVSWDRAGHEGDRAFFLEAWNGTDSFDTDRIGRGSILIPNLCVSVFGGIQPDKLTGYLEQASNALANDGMLQRFQVLVYPDPVKWEYRDAIPNKAARERVNEVFEKLDDFVPDEWGAIPANQFVKFQHFQFDRDAQKIYIEFSNGLHHSIEREDSPLIRQHLAKYEKLFPALALVLHLVECAASDKRGPVTAAAAIRAAAWCRYLESHARRCYGLVADEGLRAAQALAKRIKDGNLPKSFNPEDFTARDVRRNQWRYLTTDDAVKAALDWLEDEGWIRIRKAGGTGPGSGRPTQRYEVNPAIRSAPPKI